MRGLKIVGLVVAGLVALLALVLVGILVFVDPNDYRADIEQAVEKRTGRDLALTGDLKLSVFPWIAVQMGAASLGNAPGFGSEPFAAIDEARVGVKFWPLLKGQIEVGTVRLVGARINLMTDAQGRTNWADLGGTEDPAAASPSNESTMELPTVAGIELEKASISIDDRRTDSHQVVRDFNLKTGALKSGEPFDINTDFTFEQGTKLTAAVKANTEVTADLNASLFKLANATIDVTLKGEGYPATGMPIAIKTDAIESNLEQKTHRVKNFKVTTNLTGASLPAEGVPIELVAAALAADLTEQSFKLEGIALDLAGAKITGDMTGTDITDAPKLNGRLALAEVSPRTWLPKVGQKVPPTSDPEVLKRLSFAGLVSLTKSTAELSQMALKLDDTTLSGSLGVADFAAKALRFDLAVDRINADRYLPPPAEAPAASAPASDAPVEIPVDMLRTLNARGQVTVGHATFANMKFEKLKLGLTAREGNVRFNPVDAALYGGTYRGDVVLDARGQVPKVSLDEHLSGVNFAPLFKDVFDTTKVHGRGSANAKVTATGRNSTAMLRTLNGNIDFDVADGALEGADLWFEIKRARAVFKREAMPTRAAGPPRTQFTALKGTGVLENGVLKNQDMRADMQYLRVNGAGTVDLPQDAIDYKLTANVLRIQNEPADAAQTKELVDAKIPVRITGSLSDPKVRPDIEGYLKEEVKERVEQERDKVEQKIKDKLQDKLRGILGGG